MNYLSVLNIFESSGSRFLDDSGSRQHNPGISYFITKFSIISGQSISAVFGGAKEGCCDMWPTPRIINIWCAFVRACVRACVRAFMRSCVRVFAYHMQDATTDER
jgi:hypothetical protein